MTRGRPVLSSIRQNIVEILFFMKQGYGYEIHKVYMELFPKATQRVIYYHLKKGTALEEFDIKKIKKEQGNYSWGGEAEKIYYCLGKQAEPKILKEVKKYFESKAASSKNPSLQKTRASSKKLSQ
jgi:hypothetical protein